MSSAYRGGGALRIEGLCVAAAELRYRHFRAPDERRVFELIDRRT